MELEIANVSKACGLSGFRYITFAPPRFADREPAPVAPEEWREAATPPEPEPEPVFVEAPATSAYRPALTQATPVRPRFDLLSELAGTIEAPLAPVAPPPISRPSGKPRRAPRSASSLVPKS